MPDTTNWRDIRNRRPPNELAVEMSDLRDELIKVVQGREIGEHMDYACISPHEAGEIVDAVLAVLDRRQKEVHSQTLTDEMIDRAYEAANSGFMSRHVTRHPVDRHRLISGLEAALRGDG